MNKSKLLNYGILLLIITALLTITLFCNIGHVYAYLPTPNKIVVSGFSEMFLTPDQATVTVGVETSGNELAQIQSQNAQTMQNVINTLTQNGINSNNIKTTCFNVFETHTTQNNTSNSNITVLNCVKFKTSNISDLSSLIEKLTQAGANRFDGITFELSKSSQAYAQALQQAVNNAHQKAQVIAPNASFEIDEIVEENSFFTPTHYNNIAKSELTNIAQGEVKVSAFVRVVFNKTEDQIVSN